MTRLAAAGRGTITIRIRSWGVETSEAKPMTLTRSVIVISAAAFLVCSAGTLKAQTPAEKEEPRTAQEMDTRDDFDAGWLGLIGLLGLAGLAGRSRRDVVGTTPRPRT